MIIPCKLDPIGLFGLPSNYVRLKYLRSDGRQVIDTLYKATLNTTIHVQFTPFSTLHKAVVGIRVDLSGVNIVVYVGDVSSTANFTTDFNYRNNSRHNAFVPDFDNVYNTLLYDAYLDRFNSKVNVYKDGELYFEANHSYNVDYFNDSISTNIALFGHNASANNGGGFNGNVYGCKIKDGDIVVRNFIPALAPHDKDGNPTLQGTPCMFDTVTRTPFFNNTSFEDFLYEVATEVHGEIPVVEENEEIIEESI